MNETFLKFIDTQPKDFQGMLIPVILLYVTTYVTGKFCEKDQFWAAYLQSCQDCTRCVHPDIVLRPCQEHRDTMCGPLSELNIDWSSLRNSGDKKSSNKQKEMLDTFRENMKEIKQHEKHVREKQKYLKQKLEKESGESSDSSEDIEAGDIYIGDRHKSDEDVWNYLKTRSKAVNHRRSQEDKISDDLMALEKQNHLEKPSKNPWKGERLPPRMPFDLDSDSGLTGLHFNSKEALNLLKSSWKNEDEFNPNRLAFDEKDNLIKNFGFSEDEVKMEKLVADTKYPETVTGSEKMLLDWQTVILGIAVASCLIFFLVAAMYSIQHAKNWRKLGQYFNADVEELQTWIASSKDTKGSFPASKIYKTTTEVVHTEGGQCKYLERIINMNGKKKFNRVPSNVYEGEKQLPEAKPLTGMHPIVHKKSGDQI